MTRPKKSVAKVVTPSGEGRGMKGRGMALMGIEEILNHE
jgi:hypothetical protein